MKNFSKLLLILLVTAVYTNVYSQDENNPWAVSFGANVVDFIQPGMDFGVNMEDLLGSKDWNVLPSISVV